MYWLKSLLLGPILLPTVKHNPSRPPQTSHNKSWLHFNVGPATPLLPSFWFGSLDLRWKSNLKTSAGWAALHHNNKPSPWPLTTGQEWGSEWYLLMKLWAPNLLHSVRIIQLSAQTGIRLRDGPRHGPSIIYELHRKQPGDNRRSSSLPRDYSPAQLSENYVRASVGHTDMGSR